MLKKTLLITPFILIFLLPVFLTNCTEQNGNDKEIVAKIDDNYTITFDELSTYVYDWLYDKKFRVKTKAFSEALDAMVTNQLKRIDFFAKGLNKNQKLIQSIRRVINEELVAEYFDSVYLSKYISDDYAKKIYTTMDRQVIYQQIFLNVPLDASEKEKNSIKKKALDIKAEIDSGKDFNQLVKQYSQDSSSVNLKGFKPPVTWQQSLNNSIESLIFNFKQGEVHVLDSQDGFHIIKVTEIKKVDIKPFDQERKEIKVKLKNIYTEISLQEFESDKKKFFDEDSIKWNENVVHQLVKWSEIPRFYITIYKDTLQDAIAKNNRIILTYPKGKLDLKEYLYLLNDILIPRSAEKVYEDDLKEFIVEAIRTEIVVNKAKELDLENKIFNAYTSNPALKNQIAYLYNLAVYDSLTPEPTEEILHKFYNQERDSLYYRLRKVNIFAMIFPDKNQAEEVLKKINEGTPFEKVTGRYFVKTFIRDRDGRIKSFLSKEEPFLGEAGFKLKLNETAGPIEYTDPQKGNQYAVIKCINISPEKQLLYDDVKNTITEDYRNYYRKKIDKEVKEILWEKYDAEIFQDVLLKNLSSKN